MFFVMVTTLCRLLVVLHFELYFICLLGMLAGLKYNL